MSTETRHYLTLLHDALAADWRAWLELEDKTHWRDPSYRRHHLAYAAALRKRAREFATEGA